MARIFITTFNYEAASHPALVKITGTGSEKKVSVKLTGESLQHLLPDGRAELEYEECIQTNENTLKNGGSILECIALAVKEHEVNKPPVAL